jgi:hypothetical protein
LTVERIIADDDTRHGPAAADQMSPSELPAASYRDALAWIIRERAGANGWPPTRVDKVAGWTVVRLTAAIYGRNPAEVAKDIIARWDGEMKKARTLRGAGLELRR